MPDPMQKAVSMKRPLVSLGVPVRNGGAMLRAALDSIAAQDYPNIEVIISDNGSSDETAQIAAEFVTRYPNARAIRQEKPLSAFGNFMWLIDQANGEYFCWCAHDDLRSPDFVSGLVRALETDSHACLAFGDLEITTRHGDAGILRDYDFANDKLGPLGRIRKQTLMQCFHIYGLWRTQELRRLPKVYSSWWPDLPLMIVAAYHGTFIHVPGPKFIYLEVPKSDAERAAYQDYMSNVKSRFGNIIDLIVASFEAVRLVAGLPAAIYTVALVVEKQAWSFGTSVVRRIGVKQWLKRRLAQ